MLTINITNYIITMLHVKNMYFKVKYINNIMLLSWLVHGPLRDDMSAVYFPQYRTRGRV